MFSERRVHDNRLFFFTVDGETGQRVYEDCICGHLGKKAVATTMRTLSPCSLSFLFFLRRLRRGQDTGAGHKQLGLGKGRRLCGGALLRPRRRNDPSIRRAYP